MRKNDAGTDTVDRGGGGEGGRGRPVLVTTEYRGVFYGHARDTSGDTITLAGARMAIRWGTTRGLLELCETGPTPLSKLSARADVELRKATAVFELTAAAAAAWEAAP